MRKLILLSISVALLHVSCFKNNNKKIIVNFISENTEDNPIIKPGVGYFDSKFSKDIPTWIDVDKSDLTEIKIAPLEYIKYSNDPSILWGRNKKGENRFYFVRDSIASINQIEFKSSHWKNMDIFSGINNLEIKYTDSLGNTTRLLCPIKIRVVPTQDEVHYFPIGYKLGEFKSNDQITKIILSPTSPYDLTYHKSSTQILVDQNHDGVFINSAYLDSAGTFHNSEMFESDKLLMLNGSSYSIREISIDGSYIELETTDQKFALSQGFNIPTFQVTSVKGDTVYSNSFNNKVTFIYYWGPGCMGCELARPGLNKLFEKYIHRTDVEFLSISYINKDNLLNYLEKNPFYFPMYIWNEQIVKIFGTAVPVSVVLDKNGKVIYYSKGGGPDSYKMIDAVLQEALMTSSIL